MIDESILNMFFQYLIVICVISASVVIFVYSVKQDIKAKQVKNWPSVWGKITQSRIEMKEADEGKEHKLILGYEYTIGKKTYYSEKIKVGFDKALLPFFVEKRQKKYPYGKDVRVYCDLNKPEISYLEPETNSTFFYVLGFALMILAYFMYSQIPGIVIKTTRGANVFPEPVVGDMDDYSYMELKGVVRQNAEGRFLKIEAFEGKFVWVQYASPWCSYSAPQTQINRSLEKHFDKDIVFLTILTSVLINQGKEFTEPALQDAKAWAERFSISPERVLIPKPHLMTITPRHILFSPKGQTLFDKTGFMSEEEIQDVLGRYIEDWKNWYSLKKTAGWMKLK